MNSTMKTSLIAAAVATALGTSAAMALPPNASYNYTFYEGGGSVHETSAFWVAQQLLTPASIDVYTEVTTGAVSASYLIVTGTTNTAFSTALGNGTTPQNVLFFYRFAGGALSSGIVPFNSAAGTAASKLVYPDISSFQAAVTTGNTSPATSPTKPTYKFVGGSSGNNTQSPDWGLADQEVAFSNYPYNLNGLPAFPAGTPNIAQDPIYDTVYGVVVTNAVYNGTTAFPHPKTSFTKEEVQGILGGQVTNWNQLFSDDGTQLPSVPLWLLDRGSGAGTKAAGNQYFLNYPGALGAGGSLTPHSVTSTNVNGGYTSTALNLSGGYQDVKEPSNSQIVADLNTVDSQSSGTRYAITIIDAQSPPALNQSGGVNHYSYAKIGGTGIDSGAGADNINGTISTSYTNVVTGAYDFVFQNSLNSRSASNTPQYSTTAGGNFYAAAKTLLQSESVAGANSAGGVSGVLIDPVLAPAQDAGVILWTRNHVSTAPPQINFDATSVNTVGGVQKITYGTDGL